jgi:hypothetical protein
MMAGIFRKKLWDDVDKSKIEFDVGFTNIYNIYPHCYIYAQSMIGKKSLRIEEPMVIVGNGAREWSTETGLTFWKSFIPLIKLKIFDDIIDSYKIGGLENRQIRRSRKWSGINSGYILFPYIFIKCFTKQQIQSSEQIRIHKIYMRHYANIYFYIGFVLWIPHQVYLRIKKNLKKLFKKGEKL